jgi:hypothetical protein
MALSKKEYSEMMKYLTRPATSSAQLGARAGTRAGFKEGTKLNSKKKLNSVIILNQMYMLIQDLLIEEE